MNKMQIKNRTNSYFGRYHLGNYHHTTIREHGAGSYGCTVPVQFVTRDPYIKSSLEFFRRMPWGCNKVEKLYLQQVQIIV